jgi:hypothetical protein
MAVDLVFIHEDVGKDLTHTQNIASMEPRGHRLRRWPRPRAAASFYRMEERRT